MDSANSFGKVLSFTAGVCISGVTEQIDCVAPDQKKRQIR